MPGFPLYSLPHPAVYTRPSDTSTATAHRPLPGNHYPSVLRCCTPRRPPVRGSAPALPFLLGLPRGPHVRVTVGGDVGPQHPVQHRHRQRVGLGLAFQNCHRVAAFAPSALDSRIYREFVSPRGQVLNQSPELRDC